MRGLRSGAAAVVALAGLALLWLAAKGSLWLTVDDPLLRTGMVVVGVVSIYVGVVALLLQLGGEE